MSLTVKHLYEFGEFRLDVREKILTRGSQPVELTPKGFELLSVLVEHHGRLLKKDELMEKIWADSFVEESNLTFNIRQLRKILGDNAHNPTFIKTVRQHGYRFIADVKQVHEEDKVSEENKILENKILIEEDKPKDETFAAIVSPPPKVAFTEQPIAVADTPQKTRSFPARIFAVSVILLVAAAAVGLWYMRNKSFASSASVLAAPFTSEKLSTNGKVVHAVLSPDGKNVVYTDGKDTEKESVWLRQLEDGNSIEIIPPSESFYLGLAFSPDGGTLYFVRVPRLLDEPSGIYRVSIFGGFPQKILSGVEGWISISPDGKQISYVRRPRRDEENYSLWIADSADGRNERKLATRARPFRIGDNKFAPDGKSVAFAAGQSENGANDFGLSEVNLETGAEREVSKERFFNIKALAWLPDKSGWLITASRIPTRNTRIWQVSNGSGEAAPLTKDSESYGILSLNKEATKIVSSQIKPDFDVRLIELENSSVIREMADADSMSFAPDGKIYFSSGMSGNEEIWSVNRDGSGKRQLTNTTADESLPLPAAPDGNLIVFTSNRTGAAHVWRMNADGSNQTQVTNKEGGYPVFVSSDGEWVYYNHGIDRTLWRVSLKTGEEQMVFKKANAHFALSPDASHVAFSEQQGDETVITVAALPDGQTVKILHLADKKLLLRQIAWTPDGKNLAYISVNRDYANHNLWLQPLDESAPPRHIAALGDDETSGFGLAVSPDGKTFGISQGEWLHDAVLLKGLR